MMTFTQKCLFLLLCSLLPCVASAGLLDRLLFLLPRVTPLEEWRTMHRGGGALASLLQERQGGENMNARRMAAFPISLESHMLGMDPLFYCFTEGGSASSTISEEELQRGAGSNSENEGDQVMARTAGVVETVAEIHAREYQADDAFINLDQVPSVLAEESPEARVAFIIDNIIRRRGLDRLGMVPFAVYQSIVKELREEPSSILYDSNDFEDVD